MAQEFEGQGMFQSTLEACLVEWRNKKVPLEMVVEVPAWTCKACVTLLCKGLARLEGTCTSGLS